MNPCKDDKRKAEAPSLSSWTLCLQAELVSAGWHPLFPEQVEEDLQRDYTVTTPTEEEGESRESQWKRNSVRSIEQIQRASMQSKEREYADDVSCFVFMKSKTSPSSLWVNFTKLQPQECE